MSDDRLQQSRQQHQDDANASPPLHDFDAEHDPEVSRRLSRLDVRRAAAKGTAGSDSDRAADAIKPIPSRVPQPKAGKKGVPVAADRAPTLDEVFDPQQPSLDGASNQVVFNRLHSLVDTMYQQLLVHELEGRLKTDLLKTAPPPKTPFALKLLSWAVEQIVSKTFGYIGGMVGKELFGAAPAPAETTMTLGGTLAEPTIIETPKPAAPPPPPNWKEVASGKAGETAGSKAGGALKDKMVEQAPLNLTSADLVEQYVILQRDALVTKKIDIETRLDMAREHAGAGAASRDFIELADKLHNLLHSNQLRHWFRSKATMEWLNFLTRLSLGPGTEGQATDLPGANTLEGTEAGGHEARLKWMGGGGMIEIRIAVPETVHSTKGLVMKQATIPSSFGAMGILKKENQSLATMPVYRRIWLTTGESKLSESPAFVITPDNTVEADLTNPVLAAIGSGNQTHVGEVLHNVGLTHEDKNAWLARGIVGAHCLVGAQLVRELLREKSSGELT